MNKKSLEDLYNDTFKSIYKFFYFKVYDKQTSEDLTSETFLAFAQYIQSGKKIENPKALLYRIGGNIYNQYLRRKYNEVNLNIQEFDLFEEIEKQENLNEINNFVEMVKKYVKMLPEKQKIILNMRLIEKKTLSIIAEELKKDMNYVKTTQRRGIAKIKELIEQIPLKDI